MLYDPKWQKAEVKADPFTLESLIAWLEKQPADDKYDFYCQGECLLGQWVKDIDPSAFALALPQAEPFFYSVFGNQADLCGFSKIANGPNDYTTRRWTFGAALERARTYRSSL